MTKGEGVIDGLSDHDQEPPNLWYPMDIPRLRNFPSNVHSSPFISVRPTDWPFGFSLLPMAVCFEEKKIVGLDETHTLSTCKHHHRVSN